MSRLVEVGPNKWVDPQSVTSVTDCSQDWDDSPSACVTLGDGSWVSAPGTVPDVMAILNGPSGGAMVAELDQVARAAWRLADCPHPDHHEQLAEALDALEETGWQPPTKEGAEQ